MCRLLLPLLLLLLATPARAAWSPPGVDLTRPRLLFRAGDVAGIQAKIAADPFPAVLAAMAARTQRGLSEPLGLDGRGIEEQRHKARAAKNLAFLYAVDRTLVGGVVQPFPTATAREAVGDQAETLLLDLYPVCRLLAPGDLGGWDRDISTSEELQQWAVAYDTLKGAGYDFGDDEAEIVELIADLAESTYYSYVVPGVSDAKVHQNNHRSKVGASLVMAAIALAEYTPAPGSDPDGLREPANWLAYGLQQVDQVMRWALVAGDGAYGEGPFYFRFASQNLLGFARAWDRLVDGATWDAGGIPVPSLWRHPLFRRSIRWELDMTLPDGALVHQDDGNPGRSYYFGAAPRGIDDAALAWRWANAPTPFESGGNIDMGADLIVVHDPAVAPAPPGGSPTRFYAEGGNAIFKTGWQEDAVVVVVQAESDEAAEFGRDREGRGVFPQSHEHAEPGAFLLHAYGERLLLDPGYFSFGQRPLVNKPEDHNMILVDGRGPIEPLGSSFLWELAPFERPPSDVHASLLDTIDTGFIDAARVVARYGTGTLLDPYAGAPRVERRFLFGEGRYLALFDRVDPVAGPHTYTWLLHGNGGGTSGGTFAATATGGRWVHGAAQVEAGWAFVAATPAFSTREAIHERAGTKAQYTHTALETRVTGGAIAGVGLLAPSPSSAAHPTIEELEIAGGAALRMTEPSGAVVVAARREGGVALSSEDTGARRFATDGGLALLELDADGGLASAWAEDATRLGYRGSIRVRSRQRGELGVAVEPDRAEFVLPAARRYATVQGLPFRPRRIDGACWFYRGPFGITLLRAPRSRHLVLHADPGNSAPAADPGPDRRVGVGDVVRLDGRASCDRDRDRLVPAWELVSAPPGSDWRFEDADGWRPTLVVDRPGPYRIRLVVSDEHGAASEPVELLVVAGTRCEGGLDEDRDGFIDRDDADCDEGDPGAL